MNLGEKIAWVLENYQPNNTNKVVEYYTTSSDNHETVHKDILPQEATIKILESFAKDYEKYGECAGSDPKGQWIRIMDFEIIDS